MLLAFDLPVCVQLLYFFPPVYVRVPGGDDAASPRLEFPLTPQSTGDSLSSSASVWTECRSFACFPLVKVTA